MFQSEVFQSAANLEIGKIGESVAKDFLLKKGYKIIARNYRNKYLEIDLIARYKRCLVFVEVKTRQRKAGSIPEEALNYRQIKRLKRNALIYTAFIEYDKKYQIDAICVVLNHQRKIERISHYQNITL